MKRRSVLRACGFGLAAGLAGCGSYGVEPDDVRDEETSTPGDPGAETTTEPPDESGGETTTEPSGDGTPAGAPDGGGETTTDDPEQAPEETTTAATAPQMVSSRLSPGKAGCGGMETPSTVTFDDGAGEVVVEGAITAPNPCHAPVLAGTNYDPDADALTLTVGIEAPDPGKMCVQCVGSLRYTATVEFDGGLPESVTVVHDGRKRRTAAEETNGSA